MYPYFLGQPKKNLSGSPHVAIPVHSHLWPPATLLIMDLKCIFFIDISCLIGLFKAVESTAASLGKGTILHTHKHTHTKRLMHVPLKLACGQILNIHWEYIKIQERHDASVHTTALVWIYFLPGLQVHLIHLCFVETWFCISLFHLRALWRACIVGCWCVCAHSAFTQCIQWCLSTHPFVLSVFARLY